MVGKISFGDLSIEKLDDHHEISCFDCTNSEKIGLRFITVDAYFKNKWLYDKYLFKIFPKEASKLVKYERSPRPDHTISMYLDFLELP